MNEEASGPSRKMEAAPFCFGVISIIPLLQTSLVSRILAAVDGPSEALVLGALIVGLVEEVRSH